MENQKPVQGTPKEEFERKFNPIIDWLRENHHPHTTIIIDCNHAELLSGEMAISRNTFAPEVDVFGMLGDALKP